MNILLIEPDTLLGRAYSSALGTHGYAVTVCRQASDALQVMDQNSLDLIVLELQLTEHSGIELLHEIRSYSEWQTIPVLLHTMVPTTVLQPQQAALDRLGVVAYLYKPQTSLHQLLRMVDHLLQPVNA